MRAVAYCRVSTNKEEQLYSLESQQNFFNEYSCRNGYNLMEIYADEGKSGTKIRNRTALLKMLSDAQKKYFDIVLIKDVSRLARNTVDFLTSIRKLKALGIKVIFVNYDQTSSDNSEFMLTMLSAIAQEESANTSKRVKFGKKINAEKGRVPNLVYGYDKIKGDCFNLNINKKESEVVKKIFDMYINKSMGESKIAIELNKMGLKTKRNCKWTQNGVSGILKNEIYIGKVINAKQEVKNFLTGERKKNPEENWIITYNPNLKIIEENIFGKAKEIRAIRKEIFKITGERKSDKHMFSKVIKCSCCGYSFRRQVRTYQNTYIKWICSGRNQNGIDSCPNKTVIDESKILEEIRNYFIGIATDKPNMIKNIINRFNRKYKNEEENLITKKDLNLQINKIRKTKQKYIDMFDNDIINITELKNKTASLNTELKDLEEKLKFAKFNIPKSNLVQNRLPMAFENFESILETGKFTNKLLAGIIESITVNESGKIDVYLKALDEA